MKADLRCDPPVETIGVEIDDVREFLHIIVTQARAALAGVDRPGVLQLTRLHPTDAQERLVPSRFMINDDVERMVSLAVSDSKSGHNVYLEGRTVREDLRGQGRGTFEDTAWVWGFAVDSDADKGMGWDPTVKITVKVTTSPGNFQYWLFLRQAVNPELGRALGERIRKAVCCDHDTGTVTQPYRVAGTVNYPSKAKVARGRITVPTRLIAYDPEALWTPEEIEQAFPLPEPSQSQGEGGSGSGGEEDGGSERLDAAWQELLERGTVTGKPPKDRSAMFHRLVWHLAAKLRSPTAIIQLLRQHPNGIAAKYLKPKDRLDAEVARCLKKLVAANASSAPSIIDKWNKQHAHVLAGGKSAVLQELRTPEGHIDFKLLSSATFHEWNVEHKITMQVGQKDVTLQETHVWMASPLRRKYQDIGFFPGYSRPDFYNLWRGFAVEPRKGDCSKTLAHIRDNISCGNPDLYKWVEAWVADIVQHPAEKCGTSLALRGKQGVGKTKLGEVIGSLLGVHYKLVADPRYVTGRFNSHMISLLMLHADEGFWAGDKKAEGKLKDLVTGKSHPIEYKGREAFWVDNHVRLLVTGNADWQVPAGFEERRFAVLDVGEGRMQDGDYFAAIDAEMDAGGREALLFHLLFEVDCKAVNLRQIPHTTALVEQKLEGASPEHGWWLDVLRRGVLPGYRETAVALHDPETGQLRKEPQNETPSEVLYDDYIEHARKQGISRRAIETKLGMFLTKVVGPNLKREKKTYQVAAYQYETSKKLGPVYAFPPLSECRQMFANLLNEKIIWADDGDWG
jgi:hypothetical protein